MKKFIMFGAMIFSLALPLTASAAQYGTSDDVQVDGYTRNNGTYVQPHYRSQPDNNQFNNYNSNSYNQPAPQQKQQQPAWQDTWPDNKQQNKNRSLIY